jgi:hypothetical protein
MVVPLSMVIGLGIDYVWKKSKDMKFKIGLIVLPIIITFGYFSLIYYFHYPIHSGENFAYGYKQIAEYINAYSGQYQKIVVDPKFGSNYEFVGVPHLYLAYFTHYDPEKFLLERKDLPTGLYFSPYEIREINWGAEKSAENTLYVTPQSNLPSRSRNDLFSVKTISYPDGQPAFELFEGIVNR